MSLSNHHHNPLYVGKLCRKRVKQLYLQPAGVEPQRLQIGAVRKRVEDKAGFLRGEEAAPNMDLPQAVRCAPNAGEEDVPAPPSFWWDRSQDTAAVKGICSSATRCTSHFMSAS